MMTHETMRLPQVV